jgi:outer membrane lipoprotein-sorting protein
MSNVGQNQLAVGIRANARPTILSWLGVLAFSLLISGAVHAQGKELSAQEIADKVVRADTSSWTGTKTRVRMVLTEEGGKTKERSMEFLGRKKDNRYQGVIRFLGPAEVAGTAFLMLDKGNDEAEQYIYLPAIKRTRRIVGRERDGSFMGSDFTYADMQGMSSKDATHKKLPEEKIGADDCYLLESTINPKAGVAYSKTLTWVRKTDFVALRTKFFDSAGKHAKSLYVRKMKTVDGGLVVTEARMQSEQKQHATEVFVDSIERKDDMADAQFTPAALEHL